MNKNTLALLLAAFSLAPAAHAEMPNITGKPVIDAPPILEWPLDGGVAKPNLHNPTSNTLYDLHGKVDGCDLVLSTEGNYHMALRDVWPLVLAKFKDDPLHNALYTTSPPVVVAQIEKGVVQFDNLDIRCRPSVAVANKGVIDKLAAAGLADGEPRALYQDRGEVILVKSGNPKRIAGVWDLGREGVRLVTPNPDLETGAYQNYRDAIYHIAKADPNPPKDWTAEKLIDTIFNGASGDPHKWLTGARIHHRDEPWSVAYGRADAAVILYHLGRYTKQTFPAAFDVVPLGGSAENPQPLPGTKVDIRYVVALKGDWTPKQKAARAALIDTLMSEDFSIALERHGLKRPAVALEPIPPNKDNDLRLFYRDGALIKGSAALEKMSTGANLTLWLAGNQFFAMEDVIRTFQKENPGAGNVGLITLPPGVILKAINAGGWTYEGKEYRMQPDIYGSVDLGHLKKLKASGAMDQYMIYTHNALDLMVVKGNPKKIKGIDDLGRDDLKIMLPNPIDEGIMTFYARKVLQNHKLWDKISGGRECKACDTTPNVHFTVVHHREIPDGIKAGAVDVGIVWATETKNALDEGHAVETVALPPEDSLIDEVSYVIGSLTGSTHKDDAKKYLSFLQSEKAQDAYARFGFVKASTADLQIRAIP